MPEKVIRDPVHDVIAFDLADPADALIFRLLGCREVQRLRRVRQLGLASLAYPGADHSRYSHSLGVFATARKMLDRLASDGHGFDASTRAATLAAALLHDLGHGPFSHVFERVSGVNHEGITRRLVLDAEGEVYRTLIAHDADLPERIVGLLSCEGDRTACDVLSSQLDADRLRDNLMTGSRYGRYDLAWLLQSLTVVDGGLAVGGKGVSAAEAYLQARYHMYRHVYFHKVVRAAEGMVKLALQRARELILRDSDDRSSVDGVNLALPPGSGSVAKVLVGDRLGSREFDDLDDVSVLGCFKAWRSAGDATLARLCSGLLDRRLYKTIELPDVETAAADRLHATAADAVEHAGGDPRYDLFLDLVGGATYEPGEAGIRVQQPDDKTIDLADASPLVAALAALRASTVRLHVREPYRLTALDAVSGEAAK